MSHNRWFRIVLAFPFPLAIALLVTTAAGAAFQWVIFITSELLGILTYIGCIRLLGLDPMRYSRRYEPQQDWEKEYLWPEPYRLRKWAAGTLAMLVAFICAFPLVPASAIVTAALGILLGQWSYEGVRVIQGVYTARHA